MKNNDEFRITSAWITPDGQMTHAAIKPASAEEITHIPMADARLTLRRHLVVKAVSALAAGCSMVAKAFEVSLLSSIRIAKLVLETGVPADDRAHGVRGFHDCLGIRSTAGWAS